MSACIYIMAINSLMPVYAHQGDTQQVDQVSVGDSVCVTRIAGDGWQEIHWSVSNINYTGWLKNINVKQNAQPTEPTTREYEYAPQENAPPAEQPAPQDRSYYHSPQAPNPNFIVRPAALVMQCFPEHSQPYAVAYLNGDSLIGTKTGKPHEHAVLEEKDNTANHVFYVKAEGSGGHTLFYAFDYSQRGNDVSAIRVIGNGYDAKDKCQMDWQNTK